jgi:hypothetical protein
MIERMQSSKKATIYENAQCEDSGDGKQDLSSIQRETMPILKCKCGAKILLIHDLKAMNTAIQAHLVAHRKIIKKSKTKPKAIEDLNQFLIKQLLDLSCKSKNMELRLDGEP